MFPLCLPFQKRQNFKGDENIISYSPSLNKSTLTMEITIRKSILSLLAIAIATILYITLHRDMAVLSGFMHTQKTHLSYITPKLIHILVGRYHKGDKAIP